jgi:hypothetical protein
MYTDKKISKKRRELDMLQRGGGKGMSSFLKKFRRNHANTKLWRAVLLASACTCVHTVSTHVHTPYTYAYVILNKLVQQLIPLTDKIRYIFVQDGEK